MKVKVEVGSKNNNKSEHSERQIHRSVIMNHLANRIITVRKEKKYRTELSKQAIIEKTIERKKERKKRKKSHF
jgi:dihydroorotase